MTHEPGRDTIAAILAEAIRCAGARVVWGIPPQVTLPEPYRGALASRAAVVQEILALAVVLRLQASGPGPVPILTLMDEDAVDAGGCLTCGVPVQPGRFRCITCAVAVALALDLVPADPLAAPWSQLAPETAGDAP